jgi:hypothetical protein
LAKGNFRVCLGLLVSPDDWGLHAAHNLHYPASSWELPLSIFEIKVGSSSVWIDQGNKDLGIISFKSPFHNFCPFCSAREGSSLPRKSTCKILERFNSSWGGQHDCKSICQSSPASVPLACLAFSNGSLGTSLNDIFLAVDT